MGEDVDTAVAAAEKCAQQPADDADQNRAPERAAKAIDVKSATIPGTQYNIKAFIDQMKRPSVNKISGALRIIALDARKHLGSQATARHR